MYASTDSLMNIHMIVVTHTH